MKLRSKLILVGLVTLVLPWSAWRYLVETERFLRRGEERALLTGAELVARALAKQVVLPDGDGLYVRRTEVPVQLDGYGDEWKPWLDYAQLIEGADGPIRLALAEDERMLYLLVMVSDAQVEYARQGGRGGDQLLLSLIDDAGERRYQVSTEAPGWVQARALGARGAAIRGEWQEVAGGYSVELGVPREALGARLELTVVDADGERVQRYASGVRPLLRPASLPAGLLAPFEPAAGRLWVVDRHGWVLARGGTLYPPREPESGRWLRSLAYRYLLASPFGTSEERGGWTLRLGGSEIASALVGQADSRWQPAGDEATVIASVAVPLQQDGEVVGAVVVEQTSDALLLMTNRALVDLMGTTFVALAVALVAMFGFASRLSWRVRRLRDAAEAAVDGAGRGRFPLSGDADELGDLSRSFDRAMGELRGYTDYLKGLASKLSHELKTPLAVVSSSLENLRHEPLPREAEPYLARARGGAERLGGILRAMSEAQRLEQSLAREEPEDFDLTALLRNCVEALRDLAPEREIRLRLPQTDCQLHGSGELIAQLLDKLIDNALGFTPVGGWIEVALRQDAEGVLLSVANQGPPLPPRMQGRLFDSMVSLRETDDGRPHLGLGLYIVRLIAELHGGWVQALNLPRDQGVEFQVGLRGMPRPLPG